MAWSPKRATSMAHTSKPGSPAVIQLASDRPTPPPWESPAITPQAVQYPGRPRIGPMSGLPSGENVNGPFTTRWIPAVAKAGKCAKATSSDSERRSKSGGSSLIEKFHGVWRGDHGRQACS